MSRTVNAFLHFFPAGMLGIALSPLPYGYYMLTRVVVLLAALPVANTTYQRDKAFTAWVALFVIVAVIFNPVVPLHLTRRVWMILNVAAANLFISHFVMERRHS